MLSRWGCSNTLTRMIINGIEKCIHNWYDFYFCILGGSILRMINGFLTEPTFRAALTNYLNNQWVGVSGTSCTSESTCPVHHATHCAIACTWSYNQPNFSKHFLIFLPEAAVEVDYLMRWKADNPWSREGVWSKHRNLYRWAAVLAEMLSRLI